MMQVGLCAFCNKNSPDEPHYEVTDYRLNGVIICEKCCMEQRTKSLLVTMFGNKIPVHFLFGTEMKFYRLTTENIETWKMLATDSHCIHVTRSGVYAVSLSSCDGNNVKSRSVTLENLLFHNPQLYAKLNSENLLGPYHPIKITLADFPDQKKEIDSLYLKALASNGIFAN